MDRSHIRPIVLVEFSPSGGLFQFAAQLGEALATEGHRVTLVTGPRPELASRHPGFTIRPVLPTWHQDTAAAEPGLRRSARRAVRAGRLVAAWVVLIAELARLRPSAVLFSYWRFTFEPLFVVIIRALFRRPVLGIVAHEPLPRSDARDTSTPKSGRLLTRAFAAAWRRMDVVFVLGEHTRGVVAAHWEPAGPVIVIPHGDERALVDGDVDVTDVAGTGPVALFFGVWSTYKGIEVLLEAFALVRAQCPEARLVLAGQPGADIDLRALLSRAREIGNVDARPGYVAVRDVPALLNASRVVVTPYIRASQSGVAHLAYTARRPVVATSIGDIPAVVVDGETGLLVPPRDAEQLSAALVKVLSDAALAARLGAEGAERLARSWEIAASRVAEGLAVRSGPSR